MCRNIKRLYNFEPPVTDDEIEACAKQYVRKISGMSRPSAANTAAFAQAVEEIAAITRRLVTVELTTRAPPRSREEEAQRAKQRGQEREARMRARLAAELSGS